MDFERYQAYVKLYPRQASPTPELRVDLEAMYRPRAEELSNKSVAQCSEEFDAIAFKYGEYCIY